MRIEAPFIFPIAVFEAPEFLPFAQTRFDVAREEERLAGMPGRNKTTLEAYNYPVHWTPNERDLGDAELGQLFKEKILQCSRQFLTAIGVAMYQNEAVLKDIWLNEMVSGETQPQHNHSSSAITGTYYVDVPPNSGGIEFQSPRERFDKVNLDIVVWSPVNSRTWQYQPKPGDLCIWESWLFHGVNAAEFEGVRRSIAFDIVVGSSIGSEG